MCPSKPAKSTQPSENHQPEFEFDTSGTSAPIPHNSIHVGSNNIRWKTGTLSRKVLSRNRFQTTGAGNAFSFSESEAPSTAIHPMPTLDPDLKEEPASTTPPAAPLHDKGLDFHQHRNEEFQGPEGKVNPAGGSPGTFAKGIISEPIVAGSDRETIDLSHTVDDITLSTLLKNEAARKAAEQASANKSQFLANTSHEIRTSLNSIIGMTELTLDSDLTPSQREILRLLHSSACSLLVMINNILDISKIEAGHMIIEAVPYSLRQTIFGVLKTMVVQACRSNVDITYVVDPEIPDLLIGDPLRLCQVITNLVSNAIKFTPTQTSRKGHVAFKCRLLSEGSSEITLEFCVLDNGIGIAQDKLDLVFNTFCQADRSTAREYGGTGLGLAISKQLVNLMQGNMWAESEVSKGSRFFFTITSRTPQDTLGNLLGKFSTFGKRKILFVETAFNASGVVDCIERLGLQVMVVHAVGEVSDQNKCPRVDTIIVDAPSAAECVRGHEHLRYIPVVLLVPSMLGLNLKWCLDNGISSQLTIPVTIQDLASALIPVLESNSISSVVGPNNHVLDILLAEDDPVNQKLAVKNLEKYGHSIEIAENGNHALNAFKSRVNQGRPFDIILMDVSMPFMGGVEATKLIRSYEIDCGLSPTPIIALTAHAMVGDRECCLKAGMNEYITKPLRRRDLLNAINKLTGGRNLTQHFQSSTVGDFPIA